MKDVINDSEKVMEFLKSTRQNAEPVLSMMEKLTKAWKEFQEKFKLAKENVAEAKKPSKVLHVFLLKRIFLCMFTVWF